MVSWSPRLIVASALLIGVIQVGGSFGAASNQPLQRPLDGLAIALLVAGPLALVRRDRWPGLAVAVTVTVTVIYVWLGYPYGPIFISLVLAVFTAVGAGWRRFTWAWAGGGYLVLAMLTLFVPQAHTAEGAAHLGLVAGWLGVVLAVAEVFRTRRERAAEHERAEAEEAERRSGEQRLHLAQELHDVLAHNISLINVQASVALHLLDDEQAGARPALEAIKSASRESLGELRVALDLLRRGDEAPRMPAPRLADLDSLAAKVRAGGLDVRFRELGTPTGLTGAVELAAYRIVQEALTNVTRHARADSVAVTVAYGSGVEVEVVDDGIGGVGGDGGGISGMRRRAETLGGSFEAGPLPGGGFRVAAVLPGEGG